MRPGGFTDISTLLNVYHARDYNGVATAVQQAAADPSGSATVLLTDARALAADLTIPANVALKVIPGGLLTGPGALTVLGTFDAGPYRCFSGIAATFGPGATRVIYAEWWGASQSASAATNTAAVNAALACLAASAPGITLQCISPLTGNPLTIPDGLSNCSILGMGQFTGYTLAGATGHVLSSAHGGHTNLEIGHLLLDGADPSNGHAFSALYLGSASPTGVAASSQVYAHDLICNHVHVGVRVANCAHPLIENISGTAWVTLVYAELGTSFIAIDGVTGSTTPSFVAQAVIIDGWQGGTGAPCSDVSVAHVNVSGASGVFLLTCRRWAVEHVVCEDSPVQIGIDAEFCVDGAIGNFNVGCSVLGTNALKNGVWVRSSHRVSVANGVVRFTSDSGVQVYGRSADVVVTGVVCEQCGQGVGSPPFGSFSSLYNADAGSVGGGTLSTDVLLVGNGGSIPASPSVAGKGVGFASCVSQKSRTHGFVVQIGSQADFDRCAAVNSGSVGFDLAGTLSRVSGCYAYKSGASGEFGTAAGYQLEGAQFNSLTDCTSDQDTYGAVRIADNGNNPGVPSLHNRVRGLTSIQAASGATAKAVNELTTSDYTFVERTTWGGGYTGASALVGTHSADLGGNDPS